MNVDAAGVDVPVVLSPGAATPLPGYLLDVRRFGAVGDGVHDDTDAFLDAVAVAGQTRATVVVPPGRYPIETPLRLSHAVSLYGVGAPTLVTGHGDALIYNFTDQDMVDGLPGYSGPGSFTIAGLVLEMRAHQLPDADMHNAVTIAHAEHITVRDLVVRNVRGFHAVEPHSVAGMVIEHCRFEGWLRAESTIGREAVQIDMVNLAYDDDTPCDGVTVRGCYFGPSPVPGECGPWGRAVGGHSHGTVPHTRIRVLGNDIDSPTDPGIRPLSWSDSIVAGNSVRGGGAEGILATTGPGLPAARLTIARNTITGKRARGIYVNSVDKVSDYSDVLIDQNIVDGAATPVGWSHVTAPRLGTNIT